MSEHKGMTIADLRKSLGLSLEAFAELLGLTSKGYAHDIEKGATPSVRVALEIERVSGGKIDAASLNPDVARVRQASGEKGAAA